MKKSPRKSKGHSSPTSKVVARNKKGNNGSFRPASPSPQHPFTSRSKGDISSLGVIKISSDSDAPLPSRPTLAPAKQQAQQKEIDSHRSITTAKTKDPLGISDVKSLANHSIIDLT